jgi:hypothetical protein
LTSIPLTLIEGHMAIPRLRPLDRLPASFGRDWTLMPPHISLRAELHALYAAVSRTFCLSAATFRSLCRWEPRRASTSAPADGADPGLKLAARESISTSTQAGHYSSSRLWAALAGGTCVLGGAAVLAWIAFHHASQHQPFGASLQHDIAARRADSAGQGEDRPQLSIVSERNAATPANSLHTAPSAGSGVRDTASTRAIGDTPPTSAAAPIAKPIATPIATPATTTAITPPSPLAASARIDHPQARNTIHHNRTRQPHRETVRVQRNSQRSASSLPTRTATAVEVPASSARPFAKPSSAGDFSPFAPAALGVDEYASIRMSARTHLRSNVAPAQTQPQAANTDSTDWTNRVSQRRVTDVPEQFAK